MNNRTEFQPVIKVIYDDFCYANYEVGYFPVQIEDFHKKVINDENGFYVFELNDDKFDEIAAFFRNPKEFLLYSFISNEELIQKYSDLEIEQKNLTLKMREISRLIHE